MQIEMQHKSPTLCTHSDRDSEHPLHRHSVATFVSPSGPVVLVGCVWYLYLLLKCVMVQTANFLSQK